jgi:hypothetical protein
MVHNVFMALGLRLAHSSAAAVGASSSAVSTGYGRDHQGVQQKDCACKDEKYTFHVFSPLWGLPMWDCQVVRDNFMPVSQLANSPATY